MSSWTEVKTLNDSEWYEKARGRGFNVRQYRDSQNMIHIVIGDPETPKFSFECNLAEDYVSMMASEGVYS